MSQPPRLLFVTFTNDPGSDRIVAAMGRLGAHCGVIGSRKAFAAQSRFVKAHFPMPHLGRYLPQDFFLGPRLEEIARDWQPDAVIPLDELAARVLRDRRLYLKATPAVRSLIERSFGAPANFDTACSRQRLMGLAHRLGVRTPGQQPVAGLAKAKSTAADIGYPVVLKREQTCGGAGIAIVRDEDSLARAYRRAWLKATAKSLAGWIPGFRMVEETALSLQRFVGGSLAFRAAACANGIVLDGVNFLAESRNALATAGSTVLCQIEQPEMVEATRTIVAALGCSGFVAFDFILTPDNEAYLIEMNARPIACGHLGALYGHDIYAAMINNLAGTDFARPICASPPRTIALFPHELDRDPESPLLDSPSEVFHDIPADDPGLVDAYAAWLERRHPAQRQHLRRRFQIGGSRAAPRPAELSPRG
jgi:hypothetical protein